ncbi:MAG: phenylalanine--tRNA ligase beta subunit-related protein, partial [Planctomycetota bacterium]
MLTFDPHPLLHPIAFTTEFPQPLSELATPGNVLACHRDEFPEVVPPGLRLPDESAEELRQSVRDLFRWGGHKPTGRGKPSSEYLKRARSEGKIPTINLAVDVCNAVSVQTGLPISVIDLARGAAPYTVKVAGEESYVFNASGQEISLKGLLSLYDASGPIANSVKDSHGTKTTPATTQTLSIVWAPLTHSEHADAAAAWYRSLLEIAGAA